MYDQLLWEGPWTMGGRILQLSPWRACFQPAFKPVSTTAVWIQLYHLPIELWIGEILELVVSQFGKVLKLDQHTIYRTRAKFARVFCYRCSLLGHGESTCAQPSNPLCSG